MANFSKTTGYSTLQVELFKYLKYWKWILLSIVICSAITICYIFTLHEKYDVTASVILRDETKTNPLSASISKNSGLSALAGGNDNAEDEAMIINSYSGMKNMAYDLGLYKTYEQEKLPRNVIFYNNSPIELNVDKSLIDTLQRSLHFTVKAFDDNSIEVKLKVKKKEVAKERFSSFPAIMKTSSGDFTFTKTGHKIKDKSYTLKIVVNPLNVLAESLQTDILSTLAKRRSEIIVLNVIEVVPKRGVDKLNYLIRNYNDNALAEKNEVVRNTIRFIEERVKSISVEVDSLDNAVAIFKKSNNLIDLSSASGSFFQRYQASIDRKLAFEVHLGVQAMLEKYISDPANKNMLIPISSQMPEAVLKVIAEYNSAILERQRLLKNSNEDNPVVMALDDRIKSLHESVKLSLENMKKDFALQKKHWDSLDAEVNSKMHNIPQKELEYADIERQRQIKASLYMFLLNKKEENQLLLASGDTKAKVINEAYCKSRPVAPRKKVILLIGMFIGFCIPMLVIYMKSSLKTKISTKEELVDSTDIPVVGEICLNKTDDKVVVKDGNNSSIAELFRLVRTNIQFLLKKDQKVILVTSSISGEGKTFFTLNLGLSFSLIKDKKVVLVGLDIRNPKLANYLSIGNNKGITTFLASNDLLPQDLIIHKPDLNKNFYVIPAGPVPPNPSELLLSDRLDTLFDYLRSNFDYIIVDTAPTAMVSDTFSLDRISDLSLFLFRANYTKKPYLKLIETYVENHKLKNVSMVINGTTTKASYGYGYAQKE